jgi:hypothetical protein
MSIARCEKDRPAEKRRIERPLPFKAPAPRAALFTLEGGGGVRGRARGQSQSPSMETFFMIWGSRGRLAGPVRVDPIWWTTSMPELTCPKTV